jgi:uncharacterized RDD family membrane protein YckC
MAIQLNSHLVPLDGIRKLKQNPRGIATEALRQSKEKQAMDNLITPQACQICGDHKRMVKSTRSLYGQPVCKKCYDTFASRRQMAFFVDMVLWYGLIGLSGLVAGGLPSEGAGILLASTLAWVVFLFKDGFSGHSPGKAIMGIQVIQQHSGQPGGFWLSLKRNLLLVLPFMIPMVAFQLGSGYRIGDRWANTKVIWKKYRHTPPFAIE